MKPRVLLVHSHLWPNIARLSIAFNAAGFSVSAIAPKTHPIHAMRTPERTFSYLRLRTRGSLKAAFEAARPELIVPCDDRSLAHLHALHGACENRKGSSDDRLLSSVIETSLGAPQFYSFLRSRSQLGALSKLPEVCLPQTNAIANLRELQAWIDLYGAPAILKLDGSWGGRDVILIGKSSETRSAFLRMQLHRSLARQLKSVWASGDLQPLRDFWKKPGSVVSVQSFVPGTLANCAVACWRGEVLASIAVEVVQTRAKFGLATVVRPVEGKAMIDQARAIVRRLQISGMCGFDFVLDERSQQAKLIEINPRATQINHLCCGAGMDLALALRHAMEGHSDEFRLATPKRGDIALFPQEWRRDANSVHLENALHDLPYEEPELVRWYGYTKPLIPPAVAKATASIGGVAPSI